MMGTKPQGRDRAPGLRRDRRTWVRLAWALALATTSLCAPTPSAAQQIPPHIPGTICLTPYFWCWLPQQGPLNASCWCATYNGPVPGRVI